MVPQTQVFPNVSLTVVPGRMPADIPSRCRIFNGGAELARALLNSYFSSVSNSKNVFLSISLAGCSSHQNIQAPQHVCSGSALGGTTRRPSGLCRGCEEGWPCSGKCSRDDSCSDPGDCRVVFAMSGLPQPLNWTQAAVSKVPGIASPPECGEEE